MKQFAFAALLGLSACGPLTVSSGSDPVHETAFAVDGVKLITAGVLRGDDPSTFDQRQYKIAPQSRLLLRFESLSNSQLRIRADQPVVIRIVAESAAEKTKALASLRACPMVRDWMMAATWAAAHPYKGGEWTAGGALADDECVSAMAAGTGPSACTSEANAVCFDVSGWYRSYVVESGFNYGHALMSADAAEVTLIGDAAGSRGPRIHWSE